MKDDGLIDLRKEKNTGGDSRDVSHAGQASEPEFRIEKRPEAYNDIDPIPVSEVEGAAMKPYDKVRVKFDKFVNLVANRISDDVFDQHGDDDVIISTDLLTDLASAGGAKKEKGHFVELVLAGVFIGLVIAWFIFRN